MPNTRFSVNKFGAAWVIISISAPTESLSCLQGGIKSWQVFNYIIPSPSVLIHVNSSLSNSLLSRNFDVTRTHTPDTLKPRWPRTRKRLMACLIAADSAKRLITSPRTSAQRRLPKGSDQEVRGLANVATIWCWLYCRWHGGRWMDVIG